MNQATQPVKGRGAMLSASAMVVALFALLAFAPLASAASDPLASGTTTITLNNGFFNKLKKSKVKVQKVSPGTVKGKTVTLPVAGGELDPTTGQGKVELSGGIKFKAGKKSATVNTLVLETSTSSLSGKVAGKKMKFAGVKGLTSSRNGFGTNLSISSLKLTGSAAKQLNKKLGFTGKKKAKKSTASSSKAPQPPFKGNQVLGKGTTETQPKTVTVLPGGKASLTTNKETDEKFVRIPPNGFFTAIESFAPAEGGPAPAGVPIVTPPVLQFPITGGAISPELNGGTVTTGGGAKLVQNIEPLGGSGTTTMTLKELSVDLGTKKASAEIIVESTISPKLNLGNLNRASIADLSITGAAVNVNPTTHTISVENATATLQEVTAATLNEIFGAPFDATMTPHPTFKAGDPLGTFSFTAQTQ